MAIDVVKMWGYWLVIGGDGGGGWGVWVSGEWRGSSGVG